MNDKETKILKNKFKEILKKFWENKSSRKNIKCYICKNEIKKEEKPAKSHSIPRFILEFIVSNKNKVKSYFCIDEKEGKLNYKLKQQGIDKVGIFENLCISCESILFKNYEKFLKDKNSGVLNDDILSEIDLKIYLKEVYELEKETFEESEIDVLIENLKEDKVIKEKIGNIEISREEILEFNNFEKEKYIDLKEKLNKIIEKNFEICNQEIKKERILKYKKILNLKRREEILKCDKILNYLKQRKSILGKCRNKNTKYDSSNYIYYEIEPINYRVPLAFQCILDLQEMITVINVLGIHKIEFTEDRERYIPVSLCVFPLEKTTRIFLFSENKNELFKIFKQEFKKYSQDMQLKFINYMIFKTTNTYCYSPLIDSLTEDKIRKIINNRDKRILIISDGLEEIENEIQEIPNLLSEEYSIKELNLIIKFIKGDFILEIRNQKAIIESKNLKLRKIDKDYKIIEKLFLNYTDKYEKINLDLDNEVGKEIWYNDEEKN